MEWTCANTYKIVKFVMSSASEAELGAMFITAQEMVAMRQTLQEDSDTQSNG